MFLLLWGYFLYHMAPTVTVGDSGEFITAAATLSLAHSPSYPLYSLMGKCFSVAVPWAHLGFRINLFSVGMSAVSVLLVFCLSRRLGASKGASLFSCLLLAGSPAFFENALFTEVFALNTAMVLGVLTAALWGVRGFCLAGLLAGLGMGNHQTLLLVVPGIVLVEILWIRGRAFPHEAAEGSWNFAAKKIGLAGLFFFVGLSVYTFLPVRSHQNPPLDWGNPESATGVYRSVMRKDYGTLSLSLGDQPSRTLANQVHQLRRFFSAYGHQLTPLGLVLILWGAWMVYRQSESWFFSLTMAWFLSGPFFAWLGNLSFDAQSDGVLQRFYILPVAVTVFFAGRAWDYVSTRGKGWAWILFLLPLFLLVRSGKAFPLRHDFLTEDYSGSVLRTLSPKSAFFMDGGDDTFYSMAYQRYVRRRREDFSLFDRGGLIFKTAYGGDFRTLGRDRKEARRQEVEKKWLLRGPLFYSTMNEKILKGVSLLQRGFLYEATRMESRSQADLWVFFVLRSLYPPVTKAYRTRALAPYFPFLRAKILWRKGDHDQALTFLKRAQEMAEDVPWVKTNLTLAYLTYAFERFQVGDWDRAERLYHACLSLDSDNTDAMANLGAIWEKRKSFDHAREWYQKALRVDPNHVGALYNLSVTYWDKGRWDQVVPLMERILQINPNHAGAQRYLPAARLRLDGASK